MPKDRETAFVAAVERASDALSEAIVHAHALFNELRPDPRGGDYEKAATYLETCHDVLEQLVLSAAGRHEKAGAIVAEERGAGASDRA